MVKKYQRQKTLLSIRKIGSETDFPYDKLTLSTVLTLGLYWNIRTFEAEIIVKQNVNDEIMNTSHCIYEIDESKDISRALEEIREFYGQKVFNGKGKGRKIPEPDKENKYATLLAFGEIPEKLILNSPYNLIIIFINASSEYSVNIYFDKDVFEDWLIKEIRNRLSYIVGKIEEGKGSIHNVWTLDKTERSMLIHKFNTTYKDYGFCNSVHEVFEKQVEIYPEEIAILSSGRKLSYGEVNNAANKLANHLMSKFSLKSDDLVGLVLDRSIWMVIGILGTLKSGAAYLPFDPFCPNERNDYVLKNTPPKVIVTERKLKKSNIQYNAPVVVIEEIINSNNEAIGNMPRKNMLHNLAYVIYTSGSTGTPKGVGIEHRSLLNTQYWRKDYYGFNSSFVTLQIAPFTFDSSVNDIFSMLLWGGKLVLATEAERKDPIKIASMVKEFGVTNFNIVPSYYSIILDALPKDVSSLRVITLAGEAIPLSLLKRHFRKFPSVKIINEYGPTENAICSTAGVITRGDESKRSIGRPISNTKVFILGRGLEIIPLGVVGEIYLNGIGLARGYLNNPKMTAERFLDSPILLEEKIYKTGDLGRWLPDGRIEYLGRDDTQVKIRGMRVEIGEIEEVVRKHLRIKDMVVLAKEENPETMNLFAFIVVKDRNMKGDELREFISKRLPDYMIPQLFIPIKAIPLLANGKVNREALLKILSSKECGRRKYYIPPRNECENQLVEIWEKLMGTKPIGIRDDFFELGGNSLLAARMIVRLEALFHKRVAISSLARVRNIEGLARLLREESQDNNSVVILKKGGSKPILFLVHSHGGSVLEYEHLASLLPVDQPIYCLQAVYRNTAEIENITIENIAAKYVDEIRKIQPNGPYYIGGFCFGGLVAFEMAQQLIIKGERVAFLGMIQTRAREYPRWQRGVGPTRMKIFRMLNQLGMEKFNIDKINGAKKLKYLSERMNRVKEVFQSRMIINLWKRKMIFKKGLPLAHALELISLFHNKAFEEYFPKEYFGNAVILPAERQARGVQPDPTLGWNRHIKGDIEVCIVPGYQQTILKPPHVNHLAIAMREHLENSFRALPEQKYA